MISIKNIRMKPKLIGAFLIAGIIPLVILAVISVRLAGSALKESAFNQLHAVQIIKKGQINTYFEDRLKLLTDVQQNLRFTGGIKLFIDAFRKGLDSSEYKDLAAQRDGGFKSFEEVFGFYDVFLIDADGDVIYTVERESDLGTNLKTGPLSNSGLGRVFANSRNKIVFEDFAWYEPSNEPASFIAAPLIDKDGIYWGSAAFQISLDDINAIMGERAGMGESGETYLVGPDNLMRSDSYLDPANHSVVASFANPDKGSVDTDAAREALAGREDMKIIIDYNGNPVLSSYSPLKIGDITWAILAEIDEAEVDIPVKNLTRIVIIIAVIIAVIIAMFAFWIALGITKPVLSIAGYTEKFGKGDLTVELDIDSKDEIGEMAGDLSGAVSNLRNIMKGLSETTDALSSSSEELSTVSSEMASSAEEMNSQSNTVAAAAEQVTANVGTIASAAEQSSSVVSNISAMSEEMSSTFETISSRAQNATEKVDSMAKMGQDMADGINNIASAIEEMTASFGEVAKNTAQASKVSQTANKSAGDISAKMAGLEKASQQIGKVVNVIKDIADQTNMLALNATIEAAGAGDAGKGFAVVAGEVKELARQSAEATEEIAGQIDNIQSSTNEAVQAIGEIGKIIGEIANINETIASSVEEQTATTNEISQTVSKSAEYSQEVAKNAQEVSKMVKEITGSIDEANTTSSEVAKNVQEASSGVKEIAQSSGEAAQGVQDISKNIQGISVASNQTASGATQTNTSAQELAKIAASLEEVVSQFKV